MMFGRRERRDGFRSDSDQLTFVVPAPDGRVIPTECSSRSIGSEIQVGTRPTSASTRMDR